MNQLEIEGAITDASKSVVEALGLTLYGETDVIPNRGGVSIWFRFEKDGIRNRSLQAVSTDHTSRCGFKIHVPKSDDADLDKSIYTALSNRFRGQSIGPIHFDGDQLERPREKQNRFTTLELTLFFYVLTTHPKGG